MRVLNRMLSWVVAVTLFLALPACDDNVRRTKTVTTHEQEPPRMVSPGSEVVE